MDLVDILATLTAEEGLTLALIVGRDGLLVEGRARAGGSDLEQIAAEAIRSLGDLERLGRLLAGGNLSQVRLRYDSYLLVVETLTPTDLLIAGIQGAGGTERLLDAVARYRTQLQQALIDL